MNSQFLKFGLENNLTSEKYLKRIQAAAIVLSIIFFFAGIIFMAVFFNENQSKDFRELDDFSDFYLEKINNKINETFDTLQSMAMRPSMQNYVYHKNNYQAFISFMRNNPQCLRLGIATTEGKLYMTDTQGTIYLLDIADELFFTKAYAGEKSIQDTIKDPFDTTQFILNYAVPIYKNGEIINILIASYSLESLSQSINMTVFNQHFYSNITNQHGDFLIHSENNMVDKTANSLFRSVHIDKENEKNLNYALENNKAIKYEYSSPESGKMTAILSPLSYEGWFLQCALSDSDISMLYRMSIVGIFVLMFSALICTSLLIISFNQHNKREKLQSKTYAEQYDTLKDTALVNTFEYDPVSDLFSYIFIDETGKEKESCYMEFLQKSIFESMIAPQYSPVFKSFLLDIIKCRLTRTIELPISFFSRGYIWYKLICRPVVAQNTVERLVGSYVNVNDLVVAREKAKASAHIDFATKALSRLAFVENAEKILSYSKRHSVALLMIDLDKFKDVNDTFGHIEGDKKLRLIVSLLKQTFSFDDLIGRYGGDEFLVFLTEIDLSLLKKKISQFKSLLKDYQNNSKCIITCSIGAVYTSANEDLSLESLINTADICLYKAKALGRDTFVIETID